MRTALIRMITRPAERITMGSAGRQRWSTHFTAALMARRTVEVYQRALTQSPT